MKTFKEYLSDSISIYELTIKDKNKIDEFALTHNMTLTNILKNLKDTGGSLISHKEDLDDIIDYLDNKKIKYKIIIKK